MELNNQQEERTMRIICGTNFSTYADAAAITAGSLAVSLNLPLTLAHVLDPSRYSNPSDDLMGHLRLARRKKLQTIAERTGRQGAIVETTVMEGSPAAKLAELTASTNARFLVVSALGQIAPTRWLAGSVTDQSVQMSSVPTLVIRDPGSFEAWLHGERPLKVMAGYDFSASSEAAIRWIASLDQIAPCEITIAYVASPANERSRLGIAPPLSPLYYPSALKKFLEEEIQQKCGALLKNITGICVKADWGRPDSQMIEMAADSRADLMVVGTSQRLGLARLGSVARAVMHYSQKNVACVPEGWVASASEPPLFNGASVPASWEQGGQTTQNHYALVQ
jgi:nucleotide-binding universal stress UspA family protein